MGNEAVFVCICVYLRGFLSFPRCFKPRKSVVKPFSTELFLFRIVLRVVCLFVFFLRMSAKALILQG